MHVVCTAPLPVELSTLLPGVRLVAPTSGRLSVAELTAALPGAAALICLLTDRVDAALLDRAPDLAIVANYAVGVDNVDIAAATARGIAVANTPDVLTESTADFAFALLLAAARRLGEGERLVRSHGWSGWEPTQLLGHDVSGRRLGIIGMGRIGQAMARRARGFAMEVVYVARRELDLDARRVDLDELLATSDAVSLHCPLTPETRHIIDARALARMPAHAILVNTARGACVDEAALAEALNAGRLGGAGLDVFEREPAIHQALLGCSRAVLAPHLGSATTSTRTRMAELCTSAVAATLAGRAPPNLVNPDVWARPEAAERRSKVTRAWT